MDEVKAAFSHLWDKAAYQCQILKKEIESRYPWLTVAPGHGALDSQEHDSDGKQKGDPDLYVFYGQLLLCAIEVTGSDKIENPWTVWLGAHKAELARKAQYPIGFFFFFGKNHQLRLFATYQELQSVLDPPVSKAIRGLTLQYHILDRTYFKDERGFWAWFAWIIDERLGYHGVR